MIKLENNKLKQKNKILQINKKIIKNNHIKKSDGGGFGRISKRGIGGGFINGKECICPQCHFSKIIEDNIPCYKKKCPKCGTLLITLNLF